MYANVFQGVEARKRRKKAVERLKDPKEREKFRAFALKQKINGNKVVLRCRRRGFLPIDLQCFRSEKIAEEKRFQEWYKNRNMTAWKMKLAKMSPEERLVCEYSARITYNLST